MKRLSKSLSTQPAKRVRTKKNSTPPPTFHDIETARIEAEPHRLVTARFPINALTTTWSTGTNRALDRDHVQSLCRIFVQSGGVERTSEDNRLLLLCGKEEVEKMLNHANRKQLMEDSQSAAEASPTPSEWPLFDDWMSVNGRMAELMAGQHRAEALREYVRYTRSGEKELWWVCDIYNADTLPPDLNVRLRVNRRDPTLPDTHGQIWRQLAIISSINQDIFQGKSNEIGERMLEVLKLSSSVKFPIRRMVTLWKNTKWRDIITRWCETAVGQATFNISTWESIASCRMDDYWFAVLETVLKALYKLSPSSVERITAADWTQLAELPQDYAIEDVCELFYPTQDIRSSRTRPEDRRTGFLTLLDDEAYRSAYSTIITDMDITFPNIDALFKITRDEGRVIMRVLSHIVQWLNPSPTKINDRENNKPPLRKDFLPALEEYWQDEAEKRSILLERNVVDFVREHITQFKTIAAEAYLTQFPTDGDDSYSDRFIDAPWRNVLEIVREVTGPSFPDTPALSLKAYDNNEAARRTASTVTKTIFALLDRLPEITQSPFLKKREALDHLYSQLSRLVADWAAQQCEDVFATPLKDNRASRSASTDRQVEAARDRRQTKVTALPSDKLPRQEACDRSSEAAVCALTVAAAETPSIRGTRNEIDGRSSRRKELSLNHILGEEEDLTQARKHHRQSHTRSQRGRSSQYTERLGPSMSSQGGGSWRRGPAAQSSSR